MNKIMNFLPLVALAAAFIVVFMVLKARKPDNTAYKNAVGLGLAAAFIIIWMNLAVGIIGEPDDLANLMYVGVLAIGSIGAIIARFQPHGMARALLATALAQALVAMIALIAGMQPHIGLMVVNGFFVALFVGSAWLFRQAAREVPRDGD